MSPAGRVYLWEAERLETFFYPGRRTGVEWFARGAFRTVSIFQELDTIRGEEGVCKRSWFLFLPGEELGFPCLKNVSAPSSRER